jgi:D-glycero-alpha-D-manno-heptose 1-phosphate guanylyltransferase
VRSDPDQVTAVVLAGGFGTRIQHLLRDLPKPMAPVNGRPFVEWVLRYLAKQGLRSAILSTGYLAESVEQHFQSQPVKGITVQCVPETQPLGTGGGFLNAVKAATEKPAGWLVLNGDSMVLAPLEPMFNSLSDPALSGALIGVPMLDASRYGTIESGTTGELVAFKEKRPGAGTINAGVYLFRHSVVESFARPGPFSFEKDVFPELVARRARLKVCVTQAPFLDIGTPESLPLAESFIREHQEFF